MNKLILTNTHEIIETLSKLKLGGYGKFRSENVWQDLREEFDCPELLICQGSDLYSNYNQTDEGWGEILIKQKDKIKVIIGCSEYFSDAIFYLNPSKNEVKEDILDD